MRVDTVRLRATLGWLAMLLPWIVVALVGYFPGSISATWYTNASTVFMIILGASSILLICYRGYEFIDDLLLSLAGICGLGICLFPTDIGLPIEKVGTFMIPVELSSTLHNIFAIIFFALLAYNSLFLFTKGSATPTKNKKKRNIIYYICGAGIILSTAFLLFTDLSIKVWLTEAVALLFFGISFLTKADIYPWLFCDPKEEHE